MPGVKFHLFPLRFGTRIERALWVGFAADRMERQYRHATFALHQHHYHGVVEIGGERFALRPGDVTLSPPHVGSSYELRDASHHLCIHFFVEAAAGGDTEVAPGFFFPLHVPASAGGAALGDSMQAIHDITRHPARTEAERALMEAAATARLEALLLAGGLRFADLASECPSAPAANRSPGSGGLQAASGAARRRTSDAALEAARERLERDYAKAIPIAELVRGSGLSAHYFAARFHQRFGVTAAGYLLRVRMEMARHLLLTTDLPVKEVAYECGIADPQYFNKQFRRTTGLSPSEFRLRGTGSVPPLP
ncbi:hypothetical protein DB346_02650 [Verrucomicrobia bacterium LW23]|nr:hypothetical protein DB346_04005 [Verrucomicrobia bacterium LW23]PTY04348.1 hypothetical protein DB346_02650 [Verrucomicrobia bacterium LW23]